MKLTKNRARKPLADSTSFSKGWSQPANEGKTFNIGLGDLHSQTDGDHKGGSYRLTMSRAEAENIRDWLIEELAKPE